MLDGLIGVGLGGLVCVGGCVAMGIMAARHARRAKRQKKT